QSQRNLWFHTGDIAKIGEDGLFYFVCRKAERIRVKGEMVSAFEIEEVFMGHCAVEDCVALAIKGELVEEDIKLLVVKKPGQSCTDEELLAYGKSRMAKFMLPKLVTFVDNLPRTPTGKIERGKLS
ncbi:MAG: acyl-CoA synthetase, partial [Pseudomonadota bacterium]